MSDTSDEMAAGAALYELYMEREQEEWRTRDGRSMKISDMTDSHLLNSIRYVQRLLNRCDELLRMQGTWLEPGVDTIAADHFEDACDEADETASNIRLKLSRLLDEAKRRGLPLPTMPRIEPIPVPKNIKHCNGGIIYEF